MFLTQLLQHLTTRARDEDGAITVEYGTLIALIVLALVAGVTTFGNDVSNWIAGLAESVTANN